MAKTEYTYNIERDAFEDAVRTKRCQDCKWCGWDPDGNYCGHPKSLEESGGFGRSLQVARAADSFCGPSGKLHETKTEE